VIFRNQCIEYLKLAGTSSYHGAVKSLKQITRAKYIGKFVVSIKSYKNSWLPYI